MAVIYLNRLKRDSRSAPPPDRSAPPPDRSTAPPDRSAPPSDSSAAPPNRCAPPSDRSSPPLDKISPVSDTNVSSLGQSNIPDSNPISDQADLNLIPAIKPVSIEIFKKQDNDNDLLESDKYRTATLLLKTIHAMETSMVARKSPLPDVVSQTEPELDANRDSPLTLDFNYRHSAPISDATENSSSILNTSQRPPLLPVTPNKQSMQPQESPGPVRRVRFGSLPPTERPSIASVPSSPSMRRRSMIPLPKLLPKPRD